MNDKRLVRFQLRREFTYDLEAELTEEEFNQISQYVDWDEHGADIIFAMGQDPKDLEPSHIMDNGDDLSEDFKDYPLR